MNTFIIHPKIVHSVTCYGASNGVAKQDLSDFVAEVQTRAIEHVQDHEPPKDEAGWTGLLITIARNYLIDRARARETEDKFDDGPCENPDEHAPIAASGSASWSGSGEERDPVDKQRQLAVLMEMFERGEMPELGREILAAVADGAKAPEIGRELGLPAKEVRKRLKAMRVSY